MIFNMGQPSYAEISTIGCARRVAPCNGPECRAKKIFNSDIDRIDFIDRLASLAKEDAMEIYAWVLMPNHFHL
jgi:hypothetical protein